MTERQADILPYVAVVGAGMMGGAMARRLHTCGYTITVCDSRAEALSAFDEVGVATTTRPADCRRAEIAIVMVANDQQVLDVILSEDGIASMPTLKWIVISSTVSPTTIHEIASRLRGRSVRMVDAPVSGGARGAELGELSLMVGAEETDVADLHGILSALGRKIYYCGRTGMGEVVKILNNAIATTNSVLMEEIELVAKSLQIDVRRLFEIFESSSGRNYITRDYDGRQKFLGYLVDEPRIGPAVVDITGKDLRLAQSLAASAKVDTPILTSVVNAQAGIPVEKWRARWTR